MTNNQQTAPSVITTANCHNGLYILDVKTSTPKEGVVKWMAFWTIKLKENGVCLIKEDLRGDFFNLIYAVFGCLSKESNFLDLVYKDKKDEFEAIEFVKEGVLVRIPKGTTWQELQEIMCKFYKEKCEIISNSKRQATL